MLVLDPNRRKNAVQKTQDCDEDLQFSDYPLLSLAAVDQDCQEDEREDAHLDALEDVAFDAVEPYKSFKLTQLFACPISHRAGRPILGCWAFFIISLHFYKNN